ncbi:DUF4831 family protein [Halosquirtibacter xylanolyticus]|uniref:DUF4831 family protein n=1 Tax=Halosquirtibacter xylanolyticus TaxID=3374599 RepID=UPI003749BB1E|nr:DUF4831 family protein [Prolixibacteraceae bacterium]
MKTCKLLALLMFCSMLTIAAPDRKKGEEVVVPYTNGPVYALPATGIRVYVEATYDEFIPGPYHSFAKELLSIPNVKTKASASWKIEQVRFGSFVTADGSQYHQIKSAAVADIAVNSVGIIKGINGEFDDEVTSLPMTQNEFMPFEPTVIDWNDRSIQEFVEVNDSLPDQWTLLSEKRKAYDAAHTITKLRKRRFHMLASEYETVPPDGKAYEIVVAQLKEIEERYTALFVGKHVVRHRTFVFDVVPNNSQAVAFRFDARKGVVPTTDLSGKPMMLNVVADSNAKAILNKQAGAGSVSPDGIYYRIPCMASVSLMDGTKVLASTTMMVAQEGVRFPMAPNHSQSTPKYKITMDQKSGALKSVVLLEQEKKEED